MALKHETLALLIKEKLLAKHLLYAPRYYSTRASSMFTMPGGRQFPLQILTEGNGLVMSQWNMAEWFARVIAEAVAEGVVEHFTTHLDVRTHGVTASDAALAISTGGSNGGSHVGVARGSNLGDIT